MFSATKVLKSKIMSSQINNYTHMDIHTQSRLKKSMKIFCPYISFSIIIAHLFGTSKFLNI